MDDFMYILPILIIAGMVGFLSFRLFGVNFFDKNVNISISETERQALGRIVMKINRVIYFGKKGSAVIGTIQDAPLNVNDILMIVDKNGSVLETDISIKEMEKSRKSATDAEPGDEVSLWINININKKFLKNGLFLKKNEV